MIPERTTSIYENKIGLLRTVTEMVEDSKTTNPTGVDAGSTSSPLVPVLQAEVLYARTDQKALDILEICSGETLGEIGMILSSPNFLQNSSVTDTSTERTVFADESARRARTFLNQLEDLYQSGHPEDVSAFLSTDRKMIGFCTDVEDVTRLGQVLSALYTEGKLEDDSVTIAHYPGSFNPFPHVGHAEVATQVEGALLSAGIKNPRVVVSTVTRSGEKSIGDNFPDRVDNLVRGFVDHNRVSVLGIPSDLTKQNEVIDFRQLVAKLDSRGRGRHVMGSDTIMSRIRKARAGDPLSNYLVNSGNTIFLSVRGDSDRSAVGHAIKSVGKEFDSELVILPPPKRKLSGTIVRGLDIGARRQYAASPYVKIN